MSANAKQFYLASKIKRVRRTAAQVVQLDSQIIDVLRRGYRHVQERCVVVRNQGRKCDESKS